MISVCVTDSCFKRARRSQSSKYVVRWMPCCLNGAIATSGTDWKEALCAFNRHPKKQTLDTSCVDDKWGMWKYASFKQLSVPWHTKGNRDTWVSILNLYFLRYLFRSRSSRIRPIPSPTKKYLVCCRAGRGGGSDFPGRQRWRDSSSFFLASHLRCIQARVVPKTQSGTICMSTMSSSSISERFVRLRHLALSRNTIISIDLPVARTVQRCTRNQMSVIIVISSPTVASGLVAMSLLSSDWYTASMEETFSALTAKAALCEPSQSWRTGNLFFSGSPSKFVLVYSLLFVGWELLPKKHEPNQPDGGVVINVHHNFWKAVPLTPWLPLTWNVSVSSMCSRKKPLGPWKSTKMDFCYFS